MGRLVKRGNVYHAIFDGPKTLDKDGVEHRHQVSRACKHPDGKPMNKNDATDHMHDLERMVRLGTFIDNTATMGEYLNDWLTHMRPLIKRSTWANYEANVRNHLMPALGHKKMSETKRGDVQKLLVTRLHGQGLAPKTIDNIVSTLHKACEVAILDGKLHVNPCDKVELPSKTKPERKHATREELALIQAELQKPQYDKYRLGFLLAIAIGARRGELAAIQWHHINFDTGTVTIRQAFSRVNDTEIYLQSTKNNFVNNIPLPLLMIDLLRLAHKATPFNRDEDFVCCDQDGKPHNPAHLTEAFNRLVINAGLYVIKTGRRKDYKRKGTERYEVSYKAPKYTLHCMRHTQATLLIAAGVDLVTVASRLGHRRVSTTSDIYGHAVTEAQQKAADVANGFMG